MNENITDCIHKIITYKIEFIWEKNIYGGSLLQRKTQPYFLTMECEATENNIMISIDPQEFSTSRSIGIFLTVN